MVTFGKNHVSMLKKTFLGLRYYEIKVNGITVFRTVSFNRLRKKFREVYYQLDEISKTLGRKLPYISVNGLTKSFYFYTQYEGLPIFKDTFKYPYTHAYAS